LAEIIGGLGLSHTPTIGYALDAAKENDPAWQPVFAAFDPVKAWLVANKPDAAIVIYNDHVTSFFFDHYSAFALGVGAEWRPADEGGGAREIAPLKGHPKLARHVGQSLMRQEFDMAFFQERALDHGCFSPLSMLSERGQPLDFPVIPLAAGVLQLPIPSAQRCFNLGKAIRQAIAEYPEEMNVVIIGTGGLSHQVHGERAGFNNSDWDARFLELIASDPAKLAQMTHAELAEIGGWESMEVIMWLIMRGALSDNLEIVSKQYCLPSMTGIGTLVLKERAPLPSVPVATEPFNLPGTHPFDLEVSAKAYTLNAFLHKLADVTHREAFRTHPEDTMRAFDLSETERALISQNDWIGLIHAGAIFFGLEKLAAIQGIPNAVVYAGMRGETLAEFQASRNAPGALYSTGKTKVECDD